MQIYSMMAGKAESITSRNIILHVKFIKRLDTNRSRCYTEDMTTTLSERGQTAIPAQIRKRWKLKAHQRLEWADDGKVIYLMPVAKDPIAAFRGSATKGGLVQALLKSRREDRRMDDAKYR